LSYILEFRNPYILHTYIELVSKKLLRKRDWMGDVMKMVGMCKLCMRELTYAGTIEVGDEVVEYTECNPLSCVLTEEQFRTEVKKK
jgi:hypothetical protein